MFDYRNLATRFLYGLIIANYGFLHILLYIVSGCKHTTFANMQSSSPQLAVKFLSSNTTNLPIHEEAEFHKSEPAQIGELPLMQNVTKLRERRYKTTKARDRYSQATKSSSYSNTGQYRRNSSEPGRSSSGTISAFNQDRVPLVRLTRDILASHRYDVRVRPVTNHSKTLLIHISMSLYQIIDVNEPAQNVKMNVWMIQKWRDESLDWDPREYAMINTTILPHNVLWVPDTYLYNSVVMTADETERYMNIRADSLFWEGKRGANMSFLYPAIYTVTCRLNIRYFPYDQQNCTLTIGSWTNSKSALDYVADDHVNMASFIQNEEWEVMSFRIFRHEYKYACCPEPWVILEASIILRRKPLYYVINLIIPTSIITLVAITGFFTPASTADDRTEKINLGITTLLAMSILMLMVSDAMPTTSEFVPLIAWFYLSIIIIISIGTFLTSVILSIQGRRQYGEMPPLRVRYWIMVRVREMLCIRVPPQLALIWEELNDHPFIAYHEYFLKKSEFARSKKREAKEDSKEKSRCRRDDLIDDNVVVVCGDSARQPPPLSQKPPSIKNWKWRRESDSKFDFAASQPPVTNLDELNSRDRNLALPPAPPRRMQNSSRARLNWRRVGGAVAAHLQQQQQAVGDLVMLPKAQNSLAVPMIDMTSPCATPCRPATPLLPTPPPELNSVAHNSFIDTKRASDAASIPPLTVPPPPLPPRTPPPPEPGAPSFQASLSRKSIVVVPPPGQNQSASDGSRQDSTWESAMCAMGMTTAKRKSGASATVVAAPTGLSPEVVEMRRRRQCSLEWEFVATILDRVFLILFTFTVLSITAALMVTGRVAQAHYQTIAEQLR